MNIDTTWTVLETGDIHHCGRLVRWEDCQCSNEMCARAVCNKCQMELLDDDCEEN